MLLKLSIENWKSFKDRVEFSMVASRERQHRDRIPTIKKFPVRILPVAAIYGGNASGKTNFFKALNFMKGFICRGTQPEESIPVESYRLDDKEKVTGSQFAIELLVDEVIYEYSFCVNTDVVLEEKLVRILSTREDVLFHRTRSKRKKSNLKLHESFDNQDFLKFAFQGTRENQLYLTNSVNQNVNAFRPVFSWFRDNLELVAPDSRFEPFEQFIDEENPLFSTMNDLLPKLDTGISRLGGEDVPIESIDLPPVLRDKILDSLKDGTTARLRTEPNRYVVKKSKGKLTGKKLVSYHASHAGGQVRFEIGEESDGSQRVIDLLPAFLDLSNTGSNKVYIIDEVDRSLHTLLTRRLLHSYLSRCTIDSRSQLLFTTHDVLLMDQKLLRRDEMWVAERTSKGTSTIFSFSDYKDVRYDKDIRKSYLQGRLGGVPKILLQDSLSISDCQNSGE